MLPAASGTLASPASHAEVSKATGKGGRSAQVNAACRTPAGASAPRLTCEARALRRGYPQLTRGPGTLGLCL